MSRGFAWFLAPLFLHGFLAGTEAQGSPWDRAQPSEVNLRVGSLEELVHLAGGDGCVVRHGKLVYQWGDAARRQDVASAAKPVYVHFLLRAVQEGLIPSLDLVVSWNNTRIEGAEAENRALGIVVDATQ